MIQMSTIDEIYNAVQYQNDLITFSTIAIVASIAVVIGISLGRAFSFWKW